MDEKDHESDAALGRARIEVLIASVIDRQVETERIYTRSFGARPLFFVYGLTYVVLLGLDYFAKRSAIYDGVAVAFLVWIVILIPCELWRLRFVLPRLITGATPIIWTVGAVVVAIFLLDFVTPSVLIATGHGDIEGVKRGTFDPTDIITDIVMFPVFEELLFQGWLQTVLQRFGAPLACVATTLIFLVPHVPTTFGQLEPEVRIWIRTFPALLAFAFLRQYTKSLGAAVVCHITTNAIVTLQNAGVVPR